MAAADVTRFSGRTAWARSLETPLRAFLRTETGSAAVLLAATVAALVWANVDASSYRRRLGHHAVDPASAAPGSRSTLRRLGQQRPDDVLLLRRRARGAARVRPRRAARAAALRAAACSRASAGWWWRSAIYLALNAGHAVRARLGRGDVDRHRVRARACSRSSGPRFPDRLRAFLLTVVVVDDIVALVVIAIVYTRVRRPGPAARRASALFGADPGRRRGADPRSERVYFVLGVAAWVALLESGVDPVVVGLAMGLLTYAAPGRARRPRAGDASCFRRFREQPTPELARSARLGLESAISPNERLQQLLPPVDELRDRPAVRARERRRSRSTATCSRERFSSPITLGILLGYVVGKPLGIVGELRGC